MASDITFSELPNSKHVRQDESFTLDGSGNVALVNISGRYTKWAIGGHQQ